MSSRARSSAIPASPATADLYAVLGVEPDAGVGAIRAAYRTLAKALHPDVNKAPDSGARFAAAAEAYEVLSDPRKRGAYDQALAAQKQRAENSAGPAHYSWTNVAARNDRGGSAASISEFDEIYDTFFGGSRNTVKTTTPGRSPKPATQLGKAKPRGSRGT